MKTNLNNLIIKLMRREKSNWKRGKSYRGLRQKDISRNYKKPELNNNQKIQKKRNQQKKLLNLKAKELFRKPKQLWETIS